MEHLKWAGLAFLVFAVFTVDGQAQRRDRQGKLKPGDAAPVFTVKDMAATKTVSLAELKGKPVVLFFGSCT